MRYALILALLFTFGCGQSEEWGGTSAPVQHQASSWDSTDFLTYYLLFHHFATPSQHANFSHHMAYHRPAHLAPPPQAAKRTFTKNYIKQASATKITKPITSVKASAIKSSKPLTFKPSRTSSSFKVRSSSFRSISRGRGS